MTSYGEIDDRLVLLPVSIQVDIALFRFQYFLPRIAVIGKL
jgi:hypothetical protein